MSIVYVPILKAKEGEFGALGEIDSEVGPQIIPLFEIPAIPFDYLNDRPSRTLDVHVRGIAEKVANCWGGDRHVYIDYSAHAEDTLADGTHAFAALLNEARQSGAKAIPVIYTSSTQQTIDAASMHAHEAALGACLRLTVADFDEDVDLEAQIDHLISRMGLQTTDIDLLLDLKEIQSDLPRAILLARAMLAALPQPASWRRLIVAASSFPADLRDVDALSVATLPRREWDLWNALNRRPERLPRRDIIFADYGISHPTVKDVDPRTMTMSASIRYTGRNEWVIVKGRGVRQYGFEQYHGLCEKLIQHPAYEGRQFSWADGYIADTAERHSGPGNATTWRKVGTNHHITLVVVQLSTPADS